MRPLIFIGGALTGAAALIGAAIYDARKTEAEFSPLLKTPWKLSPEETKEQLNAYYIKALDVSMECEDTMMEALDLMSEPLELPDDSFMQKTMNAIGAGATRIGRSGKVLKLKWTMEKAGKLYERYRGVFRRANAILKEHGQVPVKLPTPPHDFTPFSRVDNSLDNDDWDGELEKCADMLRNFIEKSCAVSEDLGECLKKLNQPTLPATEAGETTI